MFLNKSIDRSINRKKSSSRTFDFADRLARRSARRVGKAAVGDFHSMRKRSADAIRRFCDHFSTFGTNFHAVEKIRRNNSIRFTSESNSWDIGQTTSWLNSTGSFKSQNRCEQLKGEVDEFLRTFSPVESFSRSMKRRNEPIRTSDDDAN